MTEKLLKALRMYFRQDAQVAHLPLVIIREFLKRGDEPSGDEIAAALLEHDPSQIEYFERRTKNSVGKVLTLSRATNAKKNCVGKFAAI